MRLLIFLYAALFFCSSANAQIDSALLVAIKKSDFAPIQKRVDEKIDINAKDNNGANVLMWAVYYCELPVIQYLVNKGTKVSDSAFIYTNEEFPLYSSLQEITIRRKKIDVLQYLADSLHLSLDEKGYNPYTKKKDRWSPLSVAARFGNAGIVNYLLQKGVEVDVVDDEETSTPLIRAAEGENWEIFDILMKTAANKKRFALQADSLAIAVAKLKQPFPNRLAKELSIAEFTFNLKRIYFPEVSAGYAKALTGLGAANCDAGNYEKAVPLFEQAIHFLKKLSAENSHVYANVLIGQTFNLFNLGQYEKAIPLLEQYLSISKKPNGGENPDYVVGLRYLALVYVRMGKYDKAMPLYPQILSIAEKIQGKEISNYTMTLNHFAFLYTSLGQYKEAIPLYKEALTIIQKKWGTDNESYSGNLIDLAYAYYRLGQYKEAMPLFEQAAAGMKKALGTKHMYYAMALNGLAYIYDAIGNVNKAESFYLQVIRILKESVGETHPQYAYALNNLAALYKQRGEQNKIISLYRQAVSIYKTALKEEHPDYAQSLLNLAGAYQHKGDYDTARQLYKDASTITQKALGKENAYYANCLSNLASLFTKTGRYDSAAFFYNEALSINQKLMGESYPENAALLNSLGLLYKTMGNDTGAANMLTKACRMQLTHLTNTYTTLSEGEKLSFLQKLTADFSYLPSLLFQRPKNADVLTQQVYQNELLLKSIVAEEQKGILNSIRQSGDSRALALYKQWYFNKAFLGKQSLLPVAQRVSYFDSLQDATNSIEQQLSRQSSVFNEQKTSEKISTNDIANNLKRNEAAIEFTRFAYYNNKWTDSIVYAALLLLPGSHVPQAIYLCEEKQILNLINTPPAIEPSYAIQKLYPGKKSVRRDALYQLIWKPLEKHLRGINTIYYAPAGLLHRIAFNALKNDAHNLLVEKYQLNQVLSTKSVAIKSDTKRKPLSASLWGNIQYSNSPANVVAVRGITPTQTDVSTSSFNFYTSDTRNSRGGEWSSLSQTKKEIASLKKLLKEKRITTVSLGDTIATEEAFKALDGNSPQLLHVATHGFFLPVADNKNNNDVSNNKFTVQQNPMFRSGLVLAGGNSAWKGEAQAEGKEDGILTAYEIAQLDLSKTDLIVLSACETALGDLQANEGVIGLQRAFKMAGVKRLMVSLWRVPDKETVELMTLFYRYWLNGLPAREALRKAQLKMKEKYTPFYWAAFVLIE